MPLLAYACEAFLSLPPLAIASVRSASDCFFASSETRLGIFAAGLPHHDSLALMSRGREWIDQQWLANVFFYGLHQLGGPSLVARANDFPGSAASHRKP